MVAHGPHDAIRIHQKSEIRAQLRFEHFNVFCCETRTFTQSQRFRCFLSLIFGERETNSIWLIRLRIAICDSPNVTRIRLNFLWIGNMVYPVHAVISFIVTHAQHRRRAS